MTDPVHLYTTAGCPYSDAAREDLEWRGVDFVEFDVERDRDAYERMLELSEGNRTVPRTGSPGTPGRGAFMWRSAPSPTTSCKAPAGAGWPLQPFSRPARSGPSQAHTLAAGSPGCTLGGAGP